MHGAPFAEEITVAAVYGRRVNALWAARRVAKRQQSE